jgi:hypothetical protein
VPEMHDLAPHMALPQLDTSALGSARSYDLTNSNTPLRGVHIPPQFQQFLEGIVGSFCGSLAATHRTHRDLLLNISKSRDSFARLLSAGDPTSKSAS